MGGSLPRSRHESKLCEDTGEHVDRRIPLVGLKKFSVEILCSVPVLVKSNHSATLGIVCTKPACSQIFRLSVLQLYSTEMLQQS